MDNKLKIGSKLLITNPTPIKGVEDKYKKGYILTVKSLYHHLSGSVHVKEVEEFSTPKDYFYLLYDEYEILHENKSKCSDNTDKVVLPKEVANAIEEVWITMGNNSTIKHLALTNWGMLHNKYPLLVSGLQAFACDNPVKYVRALVEGYDVEETPQEIIARLERTNRDMRAAFKLLNMLDVEDITNKDYTDRDKIFQIVEYVHNFSAKYIK